MKKGIKIMKNLTAIIAGIMLFSVGNECMARSYNRTTIINNHYGYHGYSGGGHPFISGMLGGMAGAAVGNMLTSPHYNYGGGSYSNYGYPQPPVIVAPPQQTIVVPPQEVIIQQPPQQVIIQQPQKN